MANQPDKRQQFRFWYPFWGSKSAAPSRPPAAPRPTPTNRPKPQPTTDQVRTPPTPPADQSQPIRRTSRTPSLSPSPSSSSSSSSSSLAMKNQPRRVSRTPSPSQQSSTQSPSRQSSQSDQVKQKTKDEPTQGLRSSPQITPASPQSPSPSKGADKSPETSNQQGMTQKEKMSDSEPIELKAQDPKTIDANLHKPTSPASNVEKDNNVSKDSEKIKPTSIPFDPLISDVPTKTIISDKNIDANLGKPTSPASNNVEKDNNVSKDLEKTEHTSIPFGPLINDMPTETAKPDKNPSKIDEGKVVPKDHESKPPVQLDASTLKEVSETKLEENKQTHSETHQEKSIPDTNHQKNDMTKPARDDNPKETIKEIVEPIPDGDPKETIKEKTSDVNNLSSNNKSETITTNNNKNDVDPAKRENPATHYPKQKEKIVAGPSSTRTSFQKNIKDGISKLVQKIHTDNGLNPGSGRGTSIITLAGENKGASMYIGHDENEGHKGKFAGRGRKLNERSATTSSKGKEKIESEKDEKDENDEEDSKIAATVNSNVQSINNSMLQESKCDTRDPGVHLRFSNRMKKEKMEKKRSEG